MLNELSSGERFILLGLLWQFINKMVQANKIKLYHKNCIFLLDEPDSYLEVYKIDEFMQIIQNDVINGLNFKVILSTHSIMTKNIFDDKNILILDKFDRNNNRFDFLKHNFNLIQQILANDLFYSFKKAKVSLEQYETIITTLEPDLDKDGKFIESLIKKYIMDSENNVKKNELFKNFYLLENFDNIQLNYKSVNSLCKINLSDYTRQNELYVIWPGKSNDACFDFLSIFNKKIHFYQITIRSDINSKLNETIISSDPKEAKKNDDYFKFEVNYKNLIEQINQDKDFTTKYFLIYKNIKQKRNDIERDYKYYEKIEKTYHYSNDPTGKIDKQVQIKTYFEKAENKPTFFQLYSINYLGEVLDCTIMKNLVTETKIENPSTQATSPIKRKFES